MREVELDRLQEERMRRHSSVVMLDRDALLGRIKHSGQWHDGRFDLAIEVGGRLAGSLDARAPERFWPPGVCEIGIELFETERGKGYGTAAIQLFAEWLLENGYPRVQASTDMSNASMRRVFEKLGWRFEGTLHAFMPTRDGRADYALYSLTRN